jgi:dTDP-4-amino-4,6-dideoxygalactose transaminase
MKIPFMDLALQHRKLSKKISSSFSNVIKKSSFLGGDEMERFKKLFSSGISGAKYTIPCSNGTSALYVAFKAAGMKPGDEVITVPNTFIATAEALSLVGAAIKFVDIDERTYNIDIVQLRKKISRKTRFIVPVFLYGLPCDMGSIMAAAASFRYQVIADACQAHGATFPYRGKKMKAGTVAKLTAFSFYPGKNLGAMGDAGAIATDDKDLAEKAMMLVNHGISKNRYFHDVAAFNFRMDNIQAAVLNTKIPLLRQWNKRRQEIARMYTQSFKKSGIISPLCPDGYTHAYHLYVIRTGDRDVLQKKLLDAGIQTGIHYPVPIHLQKAYRCLGHCKGDFPVSEKLAQEILSLPIYPEMTDPQVKYVIKNVLKSTQSL